MSQTTPADARNPAPRPPVHPVPEDKPEDEGGELGAIQIHNSVIAVIARHAAMKVPGVADLLGSIVDGIAGFVGRKPEDRGVHVELVENSVVLELSIQVEYGVNIPKVAWQVQSEVREAVEQMTGKPVRAVNVVVQGLRMAPVEEPPKGTAE